MDYPVVCFNKARHSCIVVRVTERKIFYIPMAAEGIDLAEKGVEKFNEEWTPSDYPVGMAAARYLVSDDHIPVSMAARKQLEKITSPLDVDPRLVKAAAKGFANAEREKQGLPRLANGDAPTTNQATKEDEIMATAKKKAAPAAKKAAPAAKSKAAAPAKASKKSTKAASDEKPMRTGTVGALITEGLLKGRSTEEILMDIAEKFPDSKSKASDVSWYRSKLKREGKLSD